MHIGTTQAVGPDCVKKTSYIVYRETTLQENARIKKN